LFKESIESSVLFKIPDLNTRDQAFNYKKHNVLLQFVYYIC